MRNWLVGALLGFTALSASAQQTPELSTMPAAVPVFRRIRNFATACRLALNATKTALHGAYKPATFSGHG